MFKIGISGKANSGKNTAAELIRNMLYKECNAYDTKTMAFADPVKEIVKIMFPHVKRNHLYGSSKFRKTIIKGAKDKSGNPLTIRQALIEVGTVMGRGMNDSIWLDVFDERLKKHEVHCDGIVVTDVRFPNEFFHLKEKGFILLRIKRDNQEQIDNISETTQDLIRNSEFDIVLDNNGTLDQLKIAILGDLYDIVSKKQQLD